MNLIPLTSNRRRGMLLAQALVWIALAGIVISLTGKFLSIGLTHSKRMRDMSQEIVRMQQVGERWRKDVRKADAIEMETTDEGDRMHLSAGGELVAEYVFFAEKVTRSAPGIKLPDLMLKNVKECKFERNVRPGVAGWKWGVMVDAGRLSEVHRPVEFTFSAVQLKQP